MNRIRAGATALGLVVLAAGTAAQAQETTGRVVGHVSDAATGAPLGGITVIMQGPQGEDAALTDDHGDYNFSNLPLGTYTARFYFANATTQVEQPGVVVAAEKTVRVNMKMATAAAVPQETYVITAKAPTIDIGSARISTQFDQEFMENVPIGRTYGDIIDKAPGAFIDGSGNVSIGGATGLENIYIVNGLNVTGLKYGNLESGAASIGGGSNLPIEFLQQVDVNAGGYQAEYGGAMGGVINTVLKSGSNEMHASAFGYWSPYWLSGNPNVVTPVGSPLGGFRKLDFDDSIGVEVGGPIIKDRLFYWVGLAPRITDTYEMRLTYAQQEAKDSMGMGTGVAAVDANGLPIVNQTDWRARIDETHRTYFYAGTVDWVPLPDNRLTVSLTGTPSFNNQLKSQYGINTLSSNPQWMSESLSKNNTDLSAKWVSKLFDRRWQIDALAGLHREDFFDRSPYAPLNSLNELQYAGANLWDLEHATGCEPTASGFQPCSLGPYYYQTGGFGEIDQYTAYRGSGELKFTNRFNAGGQHELKYGWHIDYGTFDIDRYYSGPSGSRAFVQVFPGSGFTPQTFFTLQPGESPIDYTSNKLDATNLFTPPHYVDDLRSSVSSLSNAFFLQDSYSPNKLRNLTVNVGARYDLEKLTGSDGNAFLDTSSISPRVGVIYDPFADGRSKVSVAYGRFYEQVPLDVAARYFGGENFVYHNGGSLSNCPGNLSNAYNWTGNGEYARCGAAPFAFPVFNSEYAQPNLQGQYHNEIVATAEREIMQDMTVRLDYQHRWLGTIIEDGYGPGFANGVLANPGHVPGSAIDTATAQRDATAAAAKASPNDPALASAAQTAAYNLGALQSLGAQPAPERTYDAITLSLNKRFSKNWLTRASYTYSRLIGNYEGLYQNETNYIAPNGSNAYDAPELNVNQNGPLPNDRPHLFRLDGFYRQPVGRGRVTAGLSFVARSGMPRNYIGNLVPASAYQIVFILPRGSAGRTPTVTQLDLKIGYGRPLSPKVNFEAFVDVFNMLNQQTAVAVDDNYTYDAAPPIANGTVSDLKFAKNTSGQPLALNPNFGHPLAYQAPISGRLGLRLTF